MIFYGVENVRMKESFSWDYIYTAFIKYVKIKNKEYICFASDENEPFVSIVCDYIEYEEFSHV